MANELRPSEQIRLKRPVPGSGYLPGDQGVVLSGYRAADFGWLSYYVRMQGQNIGSWTIFAADEIERVGEQAAVTNAGNDRGADGNATRMIEETAVPTLIPTFIPLDELDGSDSNIPIRGCR